jgi:hypothetical protein
MRQQRAETGVMQFDNDWPGVFIRGDNAAMYAMSLRSVLMELPEVTKDAYAYMIVKGLVEMLEGSNVRNSPDPQKVKWCPIESSEQTDE